MHTLRAVLRRWTTDDLEKLIELESSPEVMRFTPSRIPQSKEQTFLRLQSQLAKQVGYEPFGIWLAEEKTSHLLIGWFMLLPVAPGEVELGFMLPVNQWRKGLATEVASELLKFAKVNNVGIVHAKTDFDNVSSMRVLEKLGFKNIENTQSPDLKVYQFVVK